MKNSLLDVVLTQARTALAVFERTKSTHAERERELEDLLGAAQLVGDDALEEQLQTLSTALRSREKGAIKQLSVFVESLREQLCPPIVRSPPKPETTIVSALHTPPPGDSSPTRVHRPSRRRTTSFDTGEHRSLLGVFRGEARESLERITTLLLSATEASPDEDCLHELMRLTHGLKGAAGTVDLPNVAAMAHEYEGAFEQVRRGTLAWSLSIRDDLVEIADELLLSIETTQPQNEAASHETLKARLNRLKKNSSDASATTEFRSDDLAAVLAPDGDGGEKTHMDRRRADRRGTENPLLRVDPERVDSLMDSVGELVFDRTRIEKRVAKMSSEVSLLRESLRLLTEQRADWVASGTPVRVDQQGAALAELEHRLIEVAEGLEHELARLVEDTALLRRTEFALQDGLTAVRMQSMQSLFSRLTPALRTIARQANKQVRLVTAGGETEFDKTVADQLVDPLTQLLRNAVAHGIESPSERVDQGKSPEGRIMMTARHEGNVVVLEVSDDGGGVQVDALRERFVRQGRWSADRATHVSDERILQMIFDAGYSSRTSADQLAGRGMGLSSVRETVTRLGGEVLISSQLGVGTRFTMRLPLTTAVVGAMLFKLGGHVFAIPNVHVLDHGETALPLAHTTLDSSGNDLPLIPLHELLGFTMPKAAESCPIVLLEFMGKRLAICCDRVIGTREIVVKNLGPMLADLSLYAGGTISPSGKVQLILDPAALVAIAWPEQSAPLTPMPPDEPSVVPRVLVVDDSKAIREAMHHMLRKAGFEVVTADNGASAWHHLQTQRFELLITDLEMPGEDGFALLSRAQALVDREGIQVLVISSKDTQKNRRRASFLGATGFLTKPVSQRSLIDALRAAKRSS